MLCFYCDGMTIEKLLRLHKKHKQEEKYTSEWFPRYAYYKHHPSIASLREAADAGCPLCQAIRVELDAHQGAATFLKTHDGSELSDDVRICISYASDLYRVVDDPDAVLDVMIVGFGADESWPCDMRRFLNRKFDHSDQVRFFIPFSLARLPDAFEKINRSSVGEPFKGFNLGSEENLQTARQWLETCWSQHPRERCAALHAHPLPTRLVDLGIPGQDMVPRLVRSAGIRGFYAAVSYCWGSQAALRTTVNSYFTHTQAIAIPKIPRTIRDAMTLVRRIGFRYIWVDALCIVQDDPQDWERESAVMDQIYGNAAVTIAASASANSEEGIFDIQGFGESSFPCVCALKMNQSASLGEIVQIVPFRPKEEFYHCVFSLPLAQRGWAMQEKFLSQRIIYCGKRQLYFQCRDTNLQSNGPAVIDNTRWGLRAALMFDANPPADHLTSGRVSTVNDLWLDLVVHFSRNGVLTRVSDKLPAITGLANAVQRATGDKYMAGLWESDFVRGLMWSRGNLGHYASCGRHQGRAPTWSWAAWDGDLYYQACDTDATPTTASAKLVDYKIELSGENPYGEVKSGTLFLRAWITAWPTYALNELGALMLDEHSSELGEHLSSSQIVSFMESQSCLVMLVGLFQKEIDHQANSLYGYEIRKGVKYELWGMLVLKPLSEPRQGYYERLGMILRPFEKHEDFDLMGWTLQDLALV